MANPSCLPSADLQRFWSLITSEDSGPADEQGVASISRRWSDSSGLATLPIPTAKTFPKPSPQYAGFKEVKTGRPLLSRQSTPAPFFVRLNPDHDSAGPPTNTSKSAEVVRSKMQLLDKNSRRSADEQATSSLHPSHIASIQLFGRLELT